MSMRPYWQRHPIQMRAAAALILLTAPISLPLILLFAYWSEFMDVVAANTRILWRIVRHGEM